MKKLFFTIILSIFLISNTYAEKTNLICNYVETFYQDWDEGKYGQTIVSDSAQSSINFKIYNTTRYWFETSFRTNWDWVEGAERFVGFKKEEEYFFYAESNSKYMDIRLNRYDGKLDFVKGYTNDNRRYLWRDTYVCKKAEKKF
ncbi:hypothetical protein [Candidatus Pelagibacter sp.]|uniref:hypothetical protein n=1 Tax=Candidatus Pelagibacter sp. TaxID=2024849 RepID=UPI003F84FEB9